MPSISAEPRLLALFAAVSALKQYESVIGRDRAAWQLLMASIRTVHTNTDADQTLAHAHTCFTDRRNALDSTLAALPTSPDTDSPLRSAWQACELACLATEREERFNVFAVLALRRDFMAHLGVSA